MKADIHPGGPPGQLYAAALHRETKVIAYMLIFLLKMRFSNKNICANVARSIAYHVHFVNDQN